MKQTHKHRVKTPHWRCMGCQRQAVGANLKQFSHKPSCPYYRSPGARILVSSAKGKGRKLQQDIRDLFICIGKLGADEVESRGMGQAGEDVRFLTKHARRLFPFYVECKAHKNTIPVQKLMEELLDRGLPCLPLLFHRSDRKKCLVTLPVELLESLLLLWVKQRNEIWEDTERWRAEATVEA